MGRADLAAVLPAKVPIYIGLKKIEDFQRAEAGVQDRSAGVTGFRRNNPHTLRMAT
jgi:hypothetical protein